MPPSYQGRNARVNPDAHAPPLAAPAYDRNSPRETATFVAYYWEAYNEIVEPRRFDHYLMRKWFPDLGALGFSIVKLLRDRCYFNPATGQRRDTVELRMDELANLVGVSRSMLFKIFSQNEALGHFVRRIEQYQFADGKPRRDANLYQICMDEPVHPSDMERYDDLRATKEQERSASLVTRVFKGTPGDSKGQSDKNSYESTTETHRALDTKTAETYESTGKTHRNSDEAYESTTRTADTTYLASTEATADTTYLESARATALEEDLPFGNILTSSRTPAAGSRQARTGIPPYIPPGGREESRPLFIAWPTVLVAMAKVTSAPTFHTHIRGLTPIDLEGDTEIRSGVLTAVIGSPSEFTRSWIEKRHLPALEDALTAALDRPVVIRLTHISKDKPGADSNAS